MEEQEKNPHVMTEEEFESHLHNTLNLVTFEAVRRFKSVLRAFRRGRVTNYGYIVPNRAFHNRKNTCKRKGRHSRANNEFKKRLYAEYKRYNKHFNGQRV